MPEDPDGDHFGGSVVKERTEVPSTEQSGARLAQHQLEEVHHEESWSSSSPTPAKQQRGGASVNTSSANSSKTDRVSHTNAGLASGSSPSPANRHLISSGSGPSYKDQVRSVTDPSSEAAVSATARRVIRDSPSRSNNKSKDGPAPSSSSSVSSSEQQSAKSQQDWTEDPSESEQQQGSVVPIIRVDVVSSDGENAGPRSARSTSVYDADAFALTGGVFVKRRCMIVTVAVLLLVVAGAVSGICGAGFCGSSSGRDGGGGDNITPRPMGPPSSSPTSAPSMPVRNVTVIVDHINSVTFANETISYPSTRDLPTTEEMALRWLIEDDSLEMSVDSSNYPMRLTQRYALAALSYSLKGETWLDKIGWLEDENECAWDGIGCTDGEVTDIGAGEAFKDNNLLGSIPADIALLTAVTRINFAYNRGVGGSLPHSIGNLHSLESFDVRSCGLRDSLPATIGQWTALEYFYASDNALTGILPVALNQWSALKHFGIETNRFQGSLPELLGSWWPELESFYADRNDFTGSIPESIGQWSNLIVFWANQNKLNSSLPMVIGQWINFKNFDVFGNNISGTLPDSIGQWTGLLYFDVSENELLTGFVPESVSQWDSLEDAYFYGTNLNGSIPVGICDAAQLEDLEADCISDIECSCCTACY